jgi:hypothetical protein
MATAVLVPSAPPPAPGDQAAPDGSTWVEDVPLAERGELIYRDSLPSEPVNERDPISVRSPFTVRSPIAVRRPITARSPVTVRDPVSASPVSQRAVSAIDRWCPARDPLLRAECLLRRRQPQRALAALSGASTEQERERERVLGLTLLARCQLGQEVLSLGKQFFARWPASPLTWRIRNECPKAEPNVEGSVQRADISPVLDR